MPNFERRIRRTPKKMRHVGFEIEGFIEHPNTVGSGHNEDYYDELDFHNLFRRKYLADIKDDGSLEGEGLPLELITPPLLHSRDKAIKAICKDLAKKKGFVNKTCGGHIHIDARDIDQEIGGHDNVEKDLISLVTLFEPALYAVTGKSRLTNTFCVPTSYYPDNPENLYDHRYAGVNFVSLGSHGTIEFRCFAGTMNPDKWLARAALAEGIVNNIASMLFKGKKWESLLKYSPFETVAKVEEISRIAGRKRLVYKELIKNNGISIIEKACKANKVSPKHTKALLKDHSDLWIK